MAVHPVGQIVPRTPTPIAAPAKRARLRDAMVLALCDIIGLTADGAQALADTAPDAGCDRAVEDIDVLAWRIAEIADTTGDTLTHSLAAQIRTRCRAYRVHDAAEDRGRDVGVRILERVAQIARGLCRALEGELRRRKEARA